MLGTKIKEYIDEQGLKQKKIAAEAGLTVQTFNDMLNGRRRIETIEYFNICKALGVSIKYFAERMGYIERSA